MDNVERKQSYEQELQRLLKRIEKCKDEKKRQQLEEEYESLLEEYLDFCSAK